MASVLKMNMGTVRSRIHYTRRKLHATILKNAE
ncbi:MAG: hypothetical protein K2X77_10110 [Candidatus Obscuribacterales bacterium]|nr:hypothetical protein [Candidatus Obscuribacterales bacterium]